MTNHAQAVVERPDDYIEDQTTPPNNGLQGILDGISSAMNSVEGITESGSGIAQNIADGKRAEWEVRRDKQAFDQDQFLELLKTERGDNIKQYWVVGAAAVALILIMTT